VVDMGDDGEVADVFDRSRGHGARDSIEYGSAARFVMPSPFEAGFAGTSG
jgi:hypothetical protein